MIKPIRISEVYRTDSAHTDARGTGSIDLSNGIIIWFGPCHQIKTEDEAQEIAQVILSAVNAK